jgi:Flp pilus assembly protein CpaB
MGMALVLGVPGLCWPLPLWADPSQQKVGVLVAKKKVYLGTWIHEPADYFKRVQYVRKDAPTDFVSDFAKVKGKVLIRALAEGQAVKNQDLVAVKSASPRLPSNQESPPSKLTKKAQADPAKNKGASLLPKGMRAVSIKVQVPSKLLAAYKPGVKVDIISEIIHGDGEVVSKILFTDILLLAIEEYATRPAPREKERDPVANVANVALTPQDARVVKEAEELGVLRLVLTKAKKRR